VKEDGKKKLCIYKLNSGTTYTLRSNLDNAPRVIPVGKNLAFVTSEKTVVLIDKVLKEVASFSTEA